MGSPVASRERIRGCETVRGEPYFAYSAKIRRDCDILSADNLTALRSAQYWLTGNLENSKWEPRCEGRAFWARFSFRESHRAFPGPPVKHEGENAPSFSPACNPPRATKEKVCGIANHVVGNWGRVKVVHLHRSTGKILTVSSAMIATSRMLV